MSSWNKQGWAEPQQVLLSENQESDSMQWRLRCGFVTLRKTVGWIVISQCGCDPKTIQPTTSAHSDTKLWAAQAMWRWLQTSWRRSSAESVNRDKQSEWLTVLHQYYSTWSCGNKEGWHIYFSQLQGTRMDLLYDCQRMCPWGTRLLVLEEVCSEYKLFYYKLSFGL